MNKNNTGNNVRARHALSLQNEKKGDASTALSTTGETGCNRNCLFWIGLFLFFSFTLYGQRTISGRITDAEDGEPIPAVTVFFNNTTIGVTTDLDGNYRLRIPGEGSYSLMVSHVGYQSVVREIEPGNTSIVFNVAMQIQELEGINVSARVRFRRSDINFFWHTVLGKNPSAKTIHATNPEAVYYYYNSATRTLKVTCREPLHIVNYETGYHIQFVLNEFMHDYNTGVTAWSSHSVFSPLEPENTRQQYNWEQKRNEVYRVSLAKFIKSLYNNSLREDGFVLTTPNASGQSFLSNPGYRSLPDLGNNSKSLTFLNDGTLLLCFGKPVTDKDLETLSNAVNLAGNIKNINGLQWERSFNGVFRNYVNSGTIRIFPDGTYTNRLSVSTFTDDLSPQLTGLSMRMPIDYNPESVASSTAAPDDMAGDEYDLAGIDRRFSEQLFEFPQEKIHLHTDRDVYVSGEKIWFKVYVADALTHLMPTESRYVYVELISPVDTLMQRVMVRPVDGMFYGHLPLTDYVPTGYYTLRAYTRYMENLGDDYFFKKNIRIENVYSPANQERTTATKGMLKDDYAVSFFPEGGNSPEGVLSKVAFKVMNINGYPDIISGSLIDENGEEITSVATYYAGMGVFEYKPEAGKKYFLQCRNINGLAKRFELPPSSPSVYALSALLHQQTVWVEVNRALQAPDIPCYLLAHCRGEVLYFDVWDKPDEAISFDEEEFPSGIIQFVLFDRQMNPLSERLVFNKNSDIHEKVEFLTDKASYQKREKVVASLLTPSLWERAGEEFSPTSGRDGRRLFSSPSLRGRAGEGLLGLSHLSVSITDDMDCAVDSSTTILSSLLLSSELKGYIENPAYYLQDDEASVTALDYLMLTHGWRRYAVPEVVKGNPGHPRIPYQTSQAVAGQVKSLTRSGSVADRDISILTKEGDFGIIASDAQGKFMFQGFEYPDETSFFLQVYNKGGSRQVELIVDEESFPKLTHAPQSPVLAMPVVKEETNNDPGPDAFITKAGQRARYDEDMWLIQLSEVEVTARRIVKQDVTRMDYWANSLSDVTIGSEQIAKRNPMTVTEMLQGIPGVRVLQDGNVVIRESGNFGGNYKPLVVVDGVPVDWVDDTDENGEKVSMSMNYAFNADSPLESVNINDVESIDVFKGSSAAAFGVRGAGGVISITTKRGGSAVSKPEIPDDTFVVYTPLGYQQPVEFYSPVYETLEAKYQSNPDYRTTIFWKPDLVISDTGEATFEFYTSDFPTTYSVVIEGITSEGIIIRQVGKILVNGL